MRTHVKPIGKSVIVLIAFILIALLSAFAVRAIQAPDVNPRSDYWGSVREGVRGYTAVDFEPHEILIHNGGEIWREVRNGLIANIGPLIMAGVLGAILMFFLIVGKDKLHEPKTGRRLNRFSLAERLLHWTTAFFFIVLAITGLSNLFGRAVLIPVFGQGLFAAYMQWALWVHNFSGPIFLILLLIMFVIWVRDNIPKKIDLVWFKNLGGMIGKGPRPHAGKINGGEKAWFWVMTLSGIAMGVTGILLDFPLLVDQGRTILQTAHAIHAIVAIFFIAASFGHIYIGTIGAEGTFEGMWRGTVDESWARQHQDLWYEEKTGKSA